MKVAFISLGCAKNLVNTEQMMALCRDAGHTLLEEPAGASLARLVAVTGWLPHTTRAALTGLRKRGFAVVLEAGQGGASVYRLRAHGA